MSATTLARAPRQSAILAVVASIHVGAIAIIASGSGPITLRFPEPTRIHVLLPPPEPIRRKPPEVPTPGEYDPERVDMPTLPIPHAVDDSPVDFSPYGPSDAAEPTGSGPRVGELQPPTINLRGDRLAALINGCYPSAARRFGDEGRALARIVVDAEGRVGSWSLAESTGFSRLDAGIDCVVRRLRFEPGRRDGRAVAAEVQLPVVFRLN